MESILRSIRPSEMWTRFVDFCWHPSVRRIRPSNVNAQYIAYRYPAPGSQSQEHHKYNYKQGYKDSIHNVRYGRQDIFYQNNKSGLTIGSSILEDSSINHMSFLNNPQLKTRDNIQELIRSSFQSNKQIQSMEYWQYNLDDTYNQQFIHNSSYDMYANHPAMRQYRIDQLHRIQTYQDSRIINGSKQEVYKGDPHQWNVLDNSHSFQEITGIQNSIRNYYDSKELATLQSNIGKVDIINRSHVKLPLKTNYVE